MSNLPFSSRTANKSAEKSRSNTAFLVESIVLLFFLVAALAIFTQMFGSSINNSFKASQLSAATEVAQSAAEEFCSNPEAVAQGQAIGAGIAAKGTDQFKVTCDTETQNQGSGILYQATITVSEKTASEGEDPVYSLDVSRYVPGGAA